jgi:hypothetical protein
MHLSCIAKLHGFVVHLMVKKIRQTISLMLFPHSYEKRYRQHLLD